MLLATSAQTILTFAPVQMSSDMVNLLENFDDVFQTPKGLPSTKLQDHRIPLIDESKVIKVRPYRYPAVQKADIENLNHEMLQTGVIRDSNNPFASPVVMEPPIHLPYLVGTSNVEKFDRNLQHRQTMRKLLRFHLKRTQERMKQMVDRKRSDREFQVGDLVYPRLQPYRQHSMRKIKNQKLSPKYFEPYLVEAKVGKVAYRLQLPHRARIHSTFHVLQLKKYIVSAIGSLMLLLTGSDGVILKEPINILERRMIRKRIKL
ncbi:uncharacterized protein LOC108484927 [Gossypium arboreum]|uniref:uncharacterized protein LOC108484927 n=1 Tax=Gossypium arboreum TaxID=29729 RepID=UPI0008191DBD|nr:uncharacterized protein LOC108484927 [Gossypium arboreum]